MPISHLALVLSALGPLGQQNLDPKVVLKRNCDAMMALQAYRAQCVTSVIFDPPSALKKFEFAELTEQKPLRMRYELWRSKTPISSKTDMPPSIGFYSDGVRGFMQGGSVFQELPKERLKADTMLSGSEPWTGFFSPRSSILGLVEEILSAGGTAKATLEPNADVDGTVCNVVTIHSVTRLNGSTQEYRSTYYFGRDDHLVRRLVEHIDLDGKGFTRNFNIRNIETHPTIDPALFTYRPPRGVAASNPNPLAALLPAGRVAPNFVASDMNRKSLRLSRFRGSVVLVDFWASWCLPCRRKMPENQELAKKFAQAGLPVVVLAIDDGEDEAKFRSWVAANKLKYPNIRFAYGKGISSALYKVNAIPTQYVIDKSGVVAASFVGGDRDSLERAVRAALDR